MENLTSEKLAKSRCFPVRILLINHIRVIIILTVYGSIEELGKTSVTSFPLSFIPPSKKLKRDA